MREIGSAARGGREGWRQLEESSSAKDKREIKGCSRTGLIRKRLLVRCLNWLTPLYDNTQFLPAPQNESSFCDFTSSFCGIDRDPYFQPLPEPSRLCPGQKTSNWSDRPDPRQPFFCRHGSRRP